MRVAHQSPFVAQPCGFLAHLCGSVAHQSPFEYFFLYLRYENNYHPIFPHKFTYFILL